MNEKNITEDDTLTEDDMQFIEWAKQYRKKIKIALDNANELSDQITELKKSLTI